MKNREPFVAGQVHALVTFMTAFIAAHPDKRALTSMIDVVEQVVESRVVPASVPEATLDGSRDVIARLRASLSADLEPD